VRATDPLGIYYTYAFTYNSDSIPHLTSIANSIGTGETYNLSYSSFTLDDPFTSSSFGTVTKLTEVSLPNDSSANYQFTSDSSGQLTKAQLIYGGYIRWTYASQTYVSSRTQMEIAERYLSKDGTSGSEQGYPLYHESGTSSLTIHSCAMIDGSSVGEKYWTFSPSGSSMGLATYYQGRAPTSSPCSATPASTAMTQNAYTWTQDSGGNNYVSSVVATLDPGQTYAASKITTQTLDTNGNVTSLKNCDYSATCSGAYRQYAYSYLSSSTYTSRYIFNRLSSATVTTNGSTFTTLATIGYDGFSLGGSGTPLGWDTSYGSVTARGNPTSMLDVSGFYTTTSYDLFGNVMGATNASGVSSSVTTNSSTNYAAPSQITVGSSLTTSMSYSSFLGLTGETGPNTTSISIGYDTNARPTSSTSPFGATTTTAYNDTASPPNTCSMVDNRWTQTTLDGLGRPLHVYTGHGSSCGAGTTLTQADSTYASCGCSPLGKLATQTVPYTPGSSGATTTYTYDGIGRTLSKAVVGTGSTPDTQGTTYYIYQGNLVTVYDPANNWKIFATDGFGNLTQVTEPNPSGGTAYTTYYTYDVLGHLIQVQMPRPGFSTTQTRSWSYTGNTLMSATNPENGTVSYTYSGNKVASRTDAKGQATVYTYDSLARLTEVQRYPSGTGNPEDTCQRENYYYDGSNPLSSSYPTNALGRLSAVQYQGGYNPYASTACDTTFTEMYNYGVPGSPVGKQLTVARGSGSFNLAATYTYL
jgi:YD repeat-containing protein